MKQMKLFRVTALVLVLLVGMAAAPSALAQETFGLSDADYDFWMNAVQTSGAFNSLSYDYTFSLRVEGLGEGAPLVVSAAGGGQLGDMDGKAVFSMTAVGEVSGDQTLPFNMEVRTIDNMLYQSFGDGWFGGTLEELFGNLFGLLGVGDALPIDPESLLEGGMDDMGGMEDLLAVPGLTDAVAALGTLQASDFITISRRADMGDQAHFVIDISIADLLSSDAVAPLLAASLAQGMGEDASSMTEQEMRQIGALIGALFMGLELTYEQFINTSTNLVERGVLTLNFPISSMLTGGPEASISMEMTVNLSGYNQPISVEAPENFRPFSEM
jgi:hypothetical protein